MSVAGRRQPDSAKDREFILAEIEPKLGNKSLRKLLRQGGLGMETDPANLKRRLQEFYRICQFLKVTRPDGKLLKRLESCSKRKPCNSVLSPIVKFLEAEKVRRVFRRKIEDRPEDQIYWETVIMSIHHGHYRDVRRAAGREIKTFKSRLRNFLKKSACGEHVMKYGYFELELYNSEDVANALVKDTLRYPDQAERKEVFQKAKLLKALGWSQACGAHFFVLHFHSVTVLPDAGPYKEFMRRHFPETRQVDIGHLYGNKSVAENLDYLAGYMTKVAARLGRLLDYGKQRPLLKDDQLTAFIRIHRKWNFRNLCFRHRCG